MKRLSEHELDQRIDSFIKRKSEQFPELDEISNTPRYNTFSLLDRIKDATSTLSHMRSPRHAHH